MARFDGGWVKVHRKAILGDIGSNFIRAGLFHALVALANLSPSIASWSGKPRRVERGELVTSLKELSSLGQVDRKTILKHLRYLQLRETISIEKTHSGIFIKILNYETYQSFDAEGSQMDPKSFPNDSQMTPKSVAHIEEEKNKYYSAVTCSPARKKKLPVSFETSQELKSALGDEWLKTQLDIYPDQLYLDRELKKAFSYYQENLRKRPTTIGGWKRVLSGWFDRGWARHQASISGSKIQSTNTNPLHGVVAD